jgi:predicted protein tyrosine phosphatase
MPEMKVTPLGEAATLIAGGWPTHCVSLLDPGTRLPRRAPHHLVLEFEDLALDQRSRPAVLPTPDDVAAILRFTAGLGDGARLLVHCHIGHGRSPAVAIGILVHNGWTVSRACSEVRSQRPHCDPNRLLLELFDRALGLGGVLPGAARHRPGTGPRTEGGLLLPPGLVRPDGAGRP